MEEVRQVLCYIFERHFRQRQTSSVTNEWNPFKDHHSQTMFPLCKTNETLFCRHLRNTNGCNNKYNVVKYRQLKEKEYNLFNDESEEEEISIYLNPHYEYDSNSHPAHGK